MTFADFVTALGDLITGFPTLGVIMTVGLVLFGAGRLTAIARRR